MKRLLSIALVVAYAALIYTAACTGYDRPARVLLIIGLATLIGTAARRPKGVRQ